ncbi:hypothetical protein L3X38_023559 [Prunus dulcis]|uniref:Uncharacterized protein n=1 Tax=Prunus dulcis TaxID=3755 RepID=A0AAD4Z662_PRUDU|nr:hypothetical protein L3X38_023559 [Prunus dulcis]
MTPLLVKETLQFTRNFEPNYARPLFERMKTLYIWKSICADALFGRVNLEISGVSSAGKKVRAFGMGRTCRRQGGRSSRQTSDTSVVPAEGSPMLKEVKMEALHKISMWDFVQAAVEVTRVIALGSIVKSFGRCLPLRKGAFLR